MKKLMIIAALLIAIAQAPVKIQASPAAVIGGVAGGFGVGALFAWAVLHNCCGDKNSNE